MRLDEPSWWYGAPGGLTQRCLLPLAAAWGAAAVRSFRRATPVRSTLPVVCVGNFTAGGTGKTPLARLVALELERLGRRPAFLTRGYGGRTTGPRWVDADHDTAAEVGDEPLLLARQAPTLVARDRAAGAGAIAAAGTAADVIVMDDGLQNGTLAKDLVLAVVDGRRGIGNGQVMPAGPLRAPLQFQLDLVDAVVVNLAHDRAQSSAAADWFRHRFAGPVLAVHVEPAEPAPWLAGAPVVAYAGIGAPSRFFDLLGRLGGTVVQAVAFPDHHVFTQADARRLLQLAAAHAAILVTTEKDRVRLGGGDGFINELRAASRTLPVAMSMQDKERERLVALLESALTASRAGRPGD